MDKVLQMVILTSILFLTSPWIYPESLKESFKQRGYVEICDEQHGAKDYDALYELLDEVILFLDKQPFWKQKLYEVKERFIRSKDRAHYATDFFGLYDESKTRQQIAFYYSVHFHRFILDRYPEFYKARPLICFFETCYRLSKSYDLIFTEAFKDLNIESLFSLEAQKSSILFKVIKYLPSYCPTKPHYDGSVLSLLVDSTDSSALLLSPYKSLFLVEDFHKPARKFLRKEDQNSMLFIPGSFLKTFDIDPTPHVVIQSKKTRYAAVCFSMSPYICSSNIQNTALPYFKN